MKRVILESPFAGDTSSNILYARRALHDSLHLGEAPIASHLLYTQPGVLRDGVEAERELGITAGLEWRKVAELQVFYTDRGWSTGMLSALIQCLRESRPLELRALDGPIKLPDGFDEEIKEYLTNNFRKD